MTTSDAALLTVLVVGAGGREHMLALKLAASPRVGRVLVAPGNAGTAECAENVPVDPLDLDALVALAQREHVGLTVVGPADCTLAGIVDRFQAAGLPIFGPTAEQATLEGSKAFSKAFMLRHGIPTARHAVFSELAPALAHLDAVWGPGGAVIKMDGLAEVQSTIVTEDKAEARAMLTAALADDRYGEAGRQVLIEERLIGPEVSLLAFMDESGWRCLTPARDHKQRDDGGQGPNTEGMGAYSCPGLIDDAMKRRLEAEVLTPTWQGLVADGTGYRGMVFVGVLLTERGPMVLEYNCRFGDPETQVTLAGLTSDLVDVLEACMAGRLAEITLAQDGRAHVCVTAVDRAYPEPGEPGMPVTGLAEADAVPGARVLHALTRDVGGQTLTAGGRVINMLGSGDDIEAAREAAYRAIGSVRFAGVAPHFRRDIGGVGSRALV